MVWDLLVSIKLDIGLWPTWWQAITWSNATNQDYREWWFNQSHIIPNGCMDARGTNFQWNSIPSNDILWYFYANWPHGIIPHNYFHTILATNTWFLFRCVKHQLTAYKFNAVNYFGSKWNALRSKPSAQRVHYHIHWSTQYTVTKKYKILNFIIKSWNFLLWNISTFHPQESCA